MLTFNKDLKNWRKTVDLRNYRSMQCEKIGNYNKIELISRYLDNSDVGKNKTELLQREILSSKSIRSL